MTDSDVEQTAEVSVDRDTVQVRFSASKDWVEDELLPRYPAVTSVSQAARQAVLDGVEFRGHTANGVRGSIDADVIGALRELGGEVENRQVISINSREEIVVDDEQTVSADDGD